MPSSHLILCHPLLLPPAVFPSIRVFSNKLVPHIKWPKYWSFSFNISPSNEYSGLIFFRDGLVGSPCSPRDSEDSSPTPQFKSINSAVLSFLYGSTLTSTTDYGKHHSFDYTDHCSAQFSHSVVSNSLRPHGLQHTRLPCPSPTPRVYSNSCSLSQ